MHSKKYLPEPLKNHQFTHAYKTNFIISAQLMTEVSEKKVTENNLMKNNSQKNNHKINN